MSKETDSTQTSMTQAKRLAEVILKVSDTVILLTDKRVTLEEKMIRRYLHEVCTIAAECIRSIHQLTRDGATCADEILGELCAITEQTHGLLDELLKVAHYDLNFLEQYFEKEFYDNLISESRLIERFREIERKLSACCLNNER